MKMCRNAFNYKSLARGKSFKVEILLISRVINQAQVVNEPVKFRYTAISRVVLSSESANKALTNHLYEYKLIVS